MSRPWETLDAAETREGLLELRRRGDEFVILIGGRVLMNSALHLTEDAVAERACREVAGRPRPRVLRVLIGGLGMGYTLRAALDALPGSARVLVAEIDPVIVRWCQGPLAHLTGRALEDKRVQVEVADVGAVIATAAKEGAADPRRLFDAIVLDLYEGPREAHGGQGDPLYGRRALERARAALAPGGVLSVWSEDADAAFAERLRTAGFEVQRLRPGKGGPRHVVYLARASSSAAASRATPSRMAGGSTGAKPRSKASRRGASRPSRPPSRSPRQ
ncbi:MAG TPA: spermidine synthase [Thermoanaerobaculia bacterium]|nr:spermidine synthase [Thermoanaerobaculia bacterium]